MTAPAVVIPVTLAWGPGGVTREGFPGQRGCQDP
jgi:hypothetical protein